MKFADYDDSGIFNSRPPIAVTKNAASSYSAQRQREIGLIDKIEEILGELPIPANQHRNLIIRGVNASKYFDEFVNSDFEGHVLKVFQLIRLMKWLYFLEDPLQDWDSVRRSTIIFFVEQSVFSVETITG